MKNSRHYSFAVLPVCVLITVSLLINCGGGGGGGGSSGGGSSGSGNPAPVNHAPTISQNCDPSVDQDTLYDCDFNVTDQDGDAITGVTLPQNSPFTTLSQTGPNTWNISGTPDGTHAGNDYDMQIRATDGKDPSTSNFNINVIPVVTSGYDISGEIKNAEGGCVSNANVELTASDGVTTYNAQTTGADCEFQFQQLPEDTYTTKITATNYVSSKPGNVVVNAAKDTAGKLSNLEENLYLTSDLDFVNDTIRYNGEIRKHTQKPVWDLYLIDTDGNPVQQATIDMIKDTIINDLSGTFGNYTFTDLDINEIDTQPVFTQPADGHIMAYVNQSNPPGVNDSWFSGNQIKSGYFGINDTIAGKPVVIQEGEETLIGGGETTDTNYSDSTFYDPVTATSFSAKDKMVVEIYNSRKAGNKDVDGVDTEPDGTAWNE